MNSKSAFRRLLRQFHQGGQLWVGCAGLLWLFICRSILGG